MKLTIPQIPSILQEAAKTMRVLSGIQSSGKLHLGNYLGAMKQHIELQHEHDCFFFIANYHSLTTVQDPPLLRQYTLDVALDYLDRKSTRLNSSHSQISYAVFCLKKK